MQLGEIQLDRLGVLEVSGTHVVGCRARLSFSVHRIFQLVFVCLDHLNNTIMVASLISPSNRSWQASLVLCTQSYDASTRVV